MKTFTLKRVESAMENQSGLCTACGATRPCCEPDAREYECDRCHQSTVYGAEEILIMGLVR